MALCLTLDPIRRQCLGNAARAFAEANLGREHVLGVFERELQEMVQQREGENSPAKL